MEDLKVVRGTLPLQKLPKSKKTKNWARSVIDELDSLVEGDAYNGRGSKERKQICYDLFNGVLNMEDFEYVTNPYGFKEDQFPADLQHYDIISPKISLLLGEEINRPFNFRVITTNAEATSSLEIDRQEKIIEHLRDFVVNNGDERQLQDLQKYIKYTYQDVREINGQQALNYLTQQQRLIEKFNEGFKHALLAGDEIYWVGIIEGQPVVRVVNPLGLTVVLDPDSDNIEESAAIIEDRDLTLSTVLDEFHSELTDKNIKDLEARIGNSGNPGQDGSGIYDTTYLNIRSAEDYSKDSGRNSRGQNGLINVKTYEWKSFRKVYFVTTTEEGTGRKITEIADELFEIPKYAMKDRKTGAWKWDAFEVEIHWISEYWTATKIDDDIIIKVEAKQNQRRSMDNPSICKSGYIGKIYNATNSESTSLVERMRTYQYLYNIIFYRLELVLAKDKGKALVMDVAQLPKSVGIDTDKWLYYLDAMGVAFINSMEEGAEGQRSAFNQFSSVDLSTGQQINNYVNLLSSLEDKIGQLVGVSRQREGQTHASELVGNVERSIQQSAHITEYWFHKHNEAKKNVMEALLDVSRIAWRHGKKLSYVSDEMGRVLLNLDAATFANCEYGLFVSNTTKDTRAIESMRGLAQAMLQNDKISAAELATVIYSENMASIKHTLQDAEDRRRANEQQMQEMQGEQQQTAQQQLQEWEMFKIENENNQNDLERQNNLDVEALKQKGDMASELLKLNTQQPEDNSPDPVQEKKLELDAKKHEDGLKLDREKLALEKEKLKKELQLKKEKLAIDRKKASQQKSPPKK